MSNQTEIYIGDFTKFCGLLRIYDLYKLYVFQTQIVFASFANFDMPKFSFQNLDYLKKITCDSEQRAKICKTRYPESLFRLLADKSRGICNTR